MRGRPMWPRVICRSCRHASWQHSMRQNQRAKPGDSCRSYQCKCSGWDPIPNPRNEPTTLVSNQWEVAHNALRERFISFLDFIEDHTADRSIIGRVLREREAL